MHNDEVCWYPTTGGCFAPATAIYKAGTREISVCDYHAEQFKNAVQFRRIELP